MADSSVCLPGKVTVADSKAKLDQFFALAKKQDVLAFDSEGVNLSRIGELTLMSFGVQVSGGCHVFLLDLLNDELKERTVEAARDLLSNSSIVKIIHDCRQDSDALYHLFHPSIYLTNVFDTQIWDVYVSGSKRGLNDTLRGYGLPVNSNRVGNSLYVRQPEFWKKRPLTDEMIEYASNDIFHLFNLRQKLMDKKDSIRSVRSLTNACENAPDQLRLRRYHREVAVDSSKRGKVIGSGGKSLFKLETDTGCFVYGAKSGFLVIARNQSDLEKCINRIKSVACQRYTPKVRFYDYSCMDSDDNCGYGTDYSF